ncbi:hypothetical protein [Hydrogenophaga sp. PAMC20947]|nr:hypothetical protein [Hydrogenophaga sp. PAMC20947]
MLLKLLGLQKLLDHLFDEHWCTLWTPDAATPAHEAWPLGPED